MVIQEPLGAEEGGRRVFTDIKMFIQRNLKQNSHSHKCLTLK